MSAQKAASVQHTCTSSCLHPEHGCAGYSQTGGRYVGRCWCGFRTTPRASYDRAMSALREHGGMHLFYDREAECLEVEVGDAHLPPGRRYVRLVHWLADAGGDFNDYVVRLDGDDAIDLAQAIAHAAQAAAAPTEGSTDDDATGQGTGGGEPAAVTRTGAGDRDVGAVASEAPPAHGEGGVVEPAGDAPPLCTPPLCNRPAGHDGMHLGGDVCPGH